MLWNFEHHWDNDLTTISKLKNLECSSELIEFYMNKEKWYGCFGAMAIITYDYLNKINNLFNILNLMQLIKTREDRMDFERIFGCLLQILGDCNKSQFGNIHCYCPWGIKYKDLEKYNYLPVVKVWTGR
jgi:hypothetical protein